MKRNDPATDGLSYSKLFLLGHGSCSMVYVRPQVGEKLSFDDQTVGHHFPWAGLLLP